MQNVAERQDTPDSEPPRAGLGASMIDHVVPFHLSARGLGDLCPYVTPTATQNVADAQETAIRLGLPLTGLAVGWSVQAVPFQTSARVATGPPSEAPPSLPTATHELGETQETADNAIPDVPAGATVDWIVQPAPSVLAGSTANANAASRKARPTSVRPIIIPRRPGDASRIVHRFFEAYPSRRAVLTAPR